MNEKREKQMAQTLIHVMGKAIRIVDVEGVISDQKVSVTITLSNGDRVSSDYGNVGVRNATHTRQPENVELNYDKNMEGYWGSTSSVIGDLKVWYRDYCEYKTFFELIQTVKQKLRTADEAFQLLVKAVEMRDRILGLPATKFANDFLEEYGKLMLKSFPNQTKMILNFLQK